MHFRPMPVLTLFSLISLVILVMLGNWQYARFSEKMALDGTEPDWQQLEGDVVPGSEAMVYSFVDGNATWRRVVAVDTGPDIVFTPVEIFYQLDPPAAPEGPAMINTFRYSGRGLFLEARGRNAFTAEDRPDIARFNSLDPQALAVLLPEDSRARVLQQVFEPEQVLLSQAGQSAAGPNPFARLRNDDELPPQRHFGYAITWWGLAIALLGVYFALHHQRGRLSFRKEGPGE